MTNTTGPEFDTAVITRRETESEWLRLALEAAHMGTWEWNILTGEIKWSDNLEAIHGMPPGSFGGAFDAYLQVIHPDDRMLFQEAIQDSLRNRTDFSVEFRILWPDSSVHWMTGKGKAFYDEAGRPLRMIGLGMDITERIQATEALRASERLYRTLGEAVPDFIWSNGLEGKELFVNQRWIDYTGFTLEQAIHLDPTALYHPEDYSQLVQAWKMGRINKEAFTAEFRFLRYDGVYRWFMARAVPILDAKDTIVQWIGTMTDIHERKMAEQGLAISEARARRIFDSNIVGVIHWNLDTGLITHANDIFLTMVGYTREDLNEGRLNWQDMTPPEWRERNEKGVDEIRSRRSGSPYEKEYFRKDGSRVPIIIGGALFDDSPNEGVSFILDISEQKRIETEKTQHLQEIEALNVRLQRSILETHHRVKNNLQIISSLVEVQTDAEEETVPRAAMARIGHHTRSLAALHDLLTHQARTDIPADSISVKEAMDRLIPLLQATTGGRRIVASIANVRLPVREGASLALLVSELVSNAVKHGKGDIEVALTVQGSMARLEVCDDGPGFPPGFDPHTAANTGLSLIDSTGRHDLRGTLSYENRPEGGARAAATFPLPT